LDGRKPILCPRNDGVSNLFWEDIQEGQELPPITKDPTTRQLAQYAGASRDLYEIHYDKDYALKNGLPGVILHGALKNAYLGQLMTDWIGEAGILRRLAVQYRGMDVPGDHLVCKGKVTKKYEEAGKYLVDCEIWLENGKGETTTPGTATAEFPTRPN
jgi:acyl dehydratase